MKQSEQINELAAALSKCQRALRNPEKNRTVKVKTKAGGEYSFDYATLDSILDIIREPMADNGLALLQIPDGEQGRLTLTSRLLHGSGQFIECSLPILPVENGPQALGSAITYIRRYALTSLLGLAAEEDDDSNQAMGNHAQTQARKPSENAKPVSQPKPQPKPEVPALSQKDGIAVARIVAMFAETQCHEDFTAICTMLKEPESIVNKAEDPALVRTHVFAAIKGHKHSKPEVVEQEQEEYAA